MSIEYQVLNSNILPPIPSTEEVHVRSLDGDSFVSTEIPRFFDSSPLPTNFAGGIFPDIRAAADFIKTHEFPGVPNVESIGPLDSLDNRTTIVFMDPHKSFSHHTPIDDSEPPPSAA